MNRSCAITSAWTPWPTSRILFLLAGPVTLASARLSATVSNCFLLLTAAVGINHLMFVATGTCPASTVINRRRARRSRRARPAR